MTEFERRVEIAAPPEKVWAVMSGIVQWPSWTPTVTKVEPLTSGPAGVGAAFRLHQPKLPPAVWTIVEWMPGKGFVWESPGLGMRASGEHRVSAKGTGSEVLLRVAFSGPAAPLVGLLAGKMTLRYIELEAQGLKAAAEKA